MVSKHKADSLRMLPSGSDLVQNAYSTRSPAKKILSGFSLYRKYKMQFLRVATGEVKLFCPELSVLTVGANVFPGPGFPDPVVL